MIVVELIKAGRLKYLAGLKLQQQCVDAVKWSRKETPTKSFLLVLDHQPVYTVGIRNDLKPNKIESQLNRIKRTVTLPFPAKSMLRKSSRRSVFCIVGSFKDRKRYAIDKERLKNLGADYFETNRGGLITFHGPKQLVAYPILDLRQFVENDPTGPTRAKRIKVTGMRWYVRTLEQTVMDTLKFSYGLESHRSPHTGVWVGKGEEEKKICAIGVHNSDLVTSHGIALNCHNDLDWFDHIVPCGIEDKGVTSLSLQLGREVTAEEVGDRFVKQFEKNFNCKVTDSNFK